MLFYAYNYLVFFNIHFGGGSNLNMENNVILFLVFIIVAFAFCGATSAATLKSNHVTAQKHIVGVGNLGGDIMPSVSGSRVVWVSSYSAGTGVVMYKNLDTHSKFKVKSSKYKQSNPDISGRNVVWTQESPSPSHNTWIYLKNLATGAVSKVSPSRQRQDNGHISGTLVVWDEWLPSKKRAIFYKNLLSGFIGKVKISANDQGNPDIYGTRIVWTEETSTGHTSICLKNLATGYYGRVFITGKNQDQATISDQYVVWQQLDLNGTWKVYSKKLSSGEVVPLHTSLFQQKSPSISGTRVVWAENYGTIHLEPTAIYYINLAIPNSLRPLDYRTNPGKDGITERYFTPDISGTNVVWHVGSESVFSWENVVYKNVKGGKTVYIH